MKPEQGLKASVLRTLGFVRREALGFFRQPRLVVTLIVAPFLILLIFGLGYRTEPPPFKTLLILPSAEAGLAGQQELLGDSFGDAIDLVGTTANVTRARGELRAGEVDLLIIAPSDALTSLEEGEKAEFFVVHSEVDPVLRSSISLLARLSVEELNRLVLGEVVSTAQESAEPLEESLNTLRGETTALRLAVESRDLSERNRAREVIEETLRTIEAETTASSALRSRVAEALGIEQAGVFDPMRAQLDAIDGDDPDAAVAELESQVDDFATRVEQLRGTDPELLVSPFAVDVEDIADLPETPALFYAPGVMVVLVQHLAISFAILSLVRERQLGLTELFRASPLKPVEILVGKFATFLFMGVLVAAVLTGVMFAFGVTMLGNPCDFGLLVALVIVASLGLGFGLSSLASTDTQAVQYTMMILLASIFFTGLVLPLDQLIPSVRVLSYLLPGTYGVQGLHDIMFRGLSPDLLLISGIGLYSVVVLAWSWLVMRRHVKSPG